MRKALVPLLILAALGLTPVRAQHALEIDLDEIVFTMDEVTGKRLFEIADIPIDTGAPEGDALLEAEDGRRYAAISTIASMIIMDAIVARTAELLIGRGHDPVVYPSHNVTSDVETMTEQEEHMFDAYSCLQSKLLK